MNEPRVYKNSPFMLAFIILVFGILLLGLIFAMASEGDRWFIMIPFALLFGMVFLFVLLSATSQTTISDDEISTRNLLGTKSLRWSEISRVSGRGYALKLHNSDEDTVVSPAPQLPKYEEIIEWIGTKRPDLFNSQEYNEMTKSWWNTLLLPVIGILIIGSGFFAYTQASETFFPFLIFVVMGLIFLGISLAAPQAISIQGNSIVIGYLFGQKTLLADEIASINLRYTQTRNGKQYFVAINHVNQSTIRISGLKPNLPVVYLVLRNWHKNNISNRQTSGQN